MHDIQINLDQINTKSIHTFILKIEIIFQNLFTVKQYAKTKKILTNAKKLENVSFTLMFLIHCITCKDNPQSRFLP